MLNLVCVLKNKKKAFFFLASLCLLKFITYGFPSSYPRAYKSLITWLLGHTDKLNAFFLLAIENSTLATCNNVHGPLFNAVVATVSTLTWRGFTSSSSEVMLHGAKARKVDSE